jgi:hypothetical protein
MNMKKRLADYIEKIDLLLKSDNQETDWEKVMEEHLIQIGFFQHERLVHLIVTVTFGLLLALIANLLFAVNDFHAFGGTLILFLLIAVTLAFYIMHYYFLENGVQKLYGQHDEIRKK